MAGQGWVLYKEILGSGADDLTLSLLDLLYSATVTKDWRIEIVDGEQVRKPFERLLRQPDEKRICPTCQLIKDDYKWELCNGQYQGPKKADGTFDLLGKAHTPVETNWLHWRPLCTEAGYRGVRSQVLLNVGKTLSTGNFKDKNDRRIKDHALGIAGDIDEMLYENPDWVADTARLTRSFRVSLECTLAQNIVTVMSRSMEGWLGNRMTQSTTTHYDYSGRSSQYDAGNAPGGILNKMKSYLSV